MLFSTSIFDRFWSQLGPNLAPKSSPKSIQEPPKIDPKSHLIFDMFFYQFFIDFSSIFDPQIDQKSIKNQSTNHPNNTTSKISKMLKNHWFFNTFCHFGHAMLWSKINKNGANILSETPLKSTLQLGSILHPTWLHFGRFLEVKMEPNSLQDVFKMQSFFHSFFDIVFYLFFPNLAPTWPQLGPNLAPKSTPKLIQDPSWSEKVKKVRPKWGPNSSLSTNMSPNTPKVVPGRSHGPHFH